MAENLPMEQGNDSEVLFEKLYYEFLAQKPKWTKIRSACEAILKEISGETEVSRTRTAIENVRRVVTRISLLATPIRALCRYSEHLRAYTAEQLSWIFQTHANYLLVVARSLSVFHKASTVEALPDLLKLEFSEEIDIISHYKPVFITETLDFFSEMQKKLGDFKATYARDRTEFSSFFDFRDDLAGLAQSRLCTNAQPMVCEAFSSVFNNLIAIAEKELSGRPSPFAVGGIKVADDFVGRVGEIDGITRILREYKGTPHCSIVGPPGIGKTSLLKFLSIKEIAGYRFCHISLSKLSNYDGFIEAVCAELGSSKRASEKKCEGIIARFRRDHKDKILVLCLDDFDDGFAYLKEGSAFSFLTGLASDQEVRFLTSSKCTINEIGGWDGEKDSNFWRSFYNLRSPIHLGLMPESGVEQLISKDPELIKYKELIIQCAGNHPRFLQIACNRLFEEKKKCPELTAECLQKAKDEIEKEFKPLFVGIWNDLGKSDQTLMHLLLQLAQDGGSQTSSKNEGLAQLQELALIDEHGKPFSEYFRRFISSQNADTEPAAFDTNNRGRISSDGTLLIHVDDEMLEYNGTELRVGGDFQRNFYRSLLYLLGQSLGQGDGKIAYVSPATLWFAVTDSNNGEDPSDPEKSGNNFMKKATSYFNGKDTKYRNFKKSFNFNRDLIQVRQDRGKNVAYGVEYTKKRISIQKQFESLIDFLVKVYKPLASNSNVDLIVREILSLQNLKDPKAALERIEDVLAQPETKSYPRIKAALQICKAKCHLELGEKPKARDAKEEVDEVYLSYLEPELQRIYDSI